jgi:hypothetical protein
MKNLITKILKESLESKWNLGNKYGNKYDYQHGFCHYFAYDIIGRLKKLYPNKDINYYLLLCDEIYDFDEGELENTYLIHAYIKIDNYLLDSNGFTTFEDAKKRMYEWVKDQEENLPSDYILEPYVRETDEIPNHFFNNSFCNSGIVKKDIETFLSHPDVKELLKIFE